MPIIQCMICLARINPFDSVDSTDCGHVFHSSCFNQWRLQSATCPQCRAICTARNIRRLRFSTTLNDSSALGSTSRNSQLLDEANSEIRNLTRIAEFNSKAELKKLEIKKYQEMLKLSTAHLGCLEKVRQCEVRKLNVATSKANYLKEEFRRLGKLENELKENAKEWQGMDGIKNIINSSASEADAALLNETPESLAKMVLMLKGELMMKEMKRNEVSNTLVVCRAENAKLNGSKRRLLEKISSVEDGNNKGNQTETK